MPTRHLTGSRIREKRIDLGMKQAALAESVGISASYLNLIEHNRRRIGGKLLADLARVLGVDSALLAEGADHDLLDRLRTAAATVGEMAEVARAEELAARYPGWSALIVAQSRRLTALEQRVQTLTDRLAHDPQLAASLHEVISAVTAIRSSSSILVGPEELDADWQRRFHENIHNDSLRLAASSEALISYLEAPKAESELIKQPVDEIEAFLGSTGFHIAALEQQDARLEEFVETAGLSPLATQLLRGVAERYIADARALPLSSFEPACRETGYDPSALSLRFDAGFAQVLRRIASLPRQSGHPPTGLAVCDASGALTLSKPAPGFALPRSGGACPLWPVFQAFARPAQPLRSIVMLPGAAAQRFLCYAIAEPIAPPQFDAPPVLHSTMLVFPDPAESVSPAYPVGVSCRICARRDCVSRREPAMTGVAPSL